MNIVIDSRKKRQKRLQIVLLVLTMEENQLKPSEMVALNREIV